MDRAPIPFACHILVCVNDRKGARKSCADGVGTGLKDALKAGVEVRGWKGRIRVSQCGCMGLCARGPNVVLYPQGAWFSAVTADQIETILDEAGRRLV